MTILGFVIIRRSRLAELETRLALAREVLGGIPAMPTTKGIWQGWLASAAAWLATADTWLDGRGGKGE